MKTTAQMDGWYEDPNSINRWTTHYQCFDCGEWTMIISNQENNGHARSSDKCDTCGSKRFDQKSAISKRTFNHYSAAKKTKEFKKKINQNY